ncbi:MAG: hypothetical protein UT51_C0012G0008 [Candidatus Nomurabacteria bacterium GW2011_GWC2_39_41]|nr:MAG: hypothetical protein UT51_C0012G0008 [Candidatus Nomurabacteria bacterium GW2011_GWC2_39_41]KKT06294.1 MAG: hypothetical protein UV85_C0021G0006 [Candidatus Nomurabacteria bacterium GW2011_GWB1_43_19]KKT17436.1 MAG: hypothetical protein UW01_C0017G0009 [Candidatus Nomurabacteria bacterium GW2011_GWA2_43_66]KKT21696.1 MAG: hypothetical protein UW06_C0031G0006 [Parcubacteria group bacterium GW2011_GWE1_43_8]
MILRLGSKPYSNILNLRDEDLVLGLKKYDKKDLEGVKKIINNFKKCNFQIQILYKEDIPQDLSWYSFLNQGPHVAFEFQKAQTLFGENIFVKKVQPNPNLIRATTLMKLQQYLSEARIVFFDYDQIPDEKMYLNIKRVKMVIKDFLFFNGITDKIDFASEWDTFQHLGMIKFAEEEISLVSQLLSHRPDQITTSLSKRERIILLKRIISIIYRVYSHMSKLVSKERF